MTAQHPDQGPEFATVLRGYDRDQVDEYINRLDSWVQEWRQRAASAESSAGKARHEVSELRGQIQALEERTITSMPQSFEALGDRVGDILKAAFAAADEMRNEASTECTRLVESAQEEAARIIREAEANRDNAQSEVMALVQRREAIIGHLASLRHDLSGLLGEGAGPEPVRVDDQPEVVMGDFDEPAPVMVDLTEEPAAAAPATAATPV